MANRPAKLKSPTTPIKKGRVGVAKGVGPKRSRVSVKGAGK